MHSVNPRLLSQRPTDRALVLRPAIPPGRRNLLPSRLDYGLVQPGADPIKQGGVTAPPADGNVSVSIQRDTSGGRFAITQVDVYDVVLVDPSELPPPPRGPVFMLVLANRTDGSAPVPVTSDQAVGANVKFTAPVAATGEHFTAALEFAADTWPSPIDLPITADVGAFDLQLRWGLANSFGILANHKSPSDPLEGNWFAGHVNAILPIQGGSDAGALLVGANTGGVWLARPATPDIPATAEPLSDDWDDPNITALVQGPKGAEHFYAGASGHVYETNPLHDASIRAWRRVTTSSFGGVFAMGIVQGSPARIVLATSQGVYWTEIPSITAPYQWRAATKMIDGTQLPPGTYSGLVITGSRVVVAAYGVDLGSHHYGVFHGDWSSGDLVMARSGMPPRGPSDFTSVDQNMFRTSLAVCDGSPDIVYAVSSRDDRGLGPMLRSSDGGRSWALLSPTVGGQPISVLAGSQGEYNNCIAVAPGDPSTLAIGWQNGTFLSHDSGATFTQFQNANLHSDVHSLTFDSADPTGRTMYIGSDGGVAITRDGGATFDSTTNRQLANLEFYSTFVTRDFYGTLSVQRDLIAGGLQDNSNVVCQLTGPSTLTPWAPIDGGCDGGVVIFVGTGQVLTDLVCAGQGSNLWARSLHGRSLYDIDSGAAVGVPMPNGPAVLLSPILEAVVSPVFKNQAGQLMYAVASPFNTLLVFGLFANSDGAGLHAELIGTAPDASQPDSISALGSFDGTTVLIGTGAGRAFQLVPTSSGPATAAALSFSSDLLTGAMTRILTISPTLAFANYNGTLVSRIVRFDGQSWSGSDQGLPGDPYYALANFGDQLIFTATDDRVFSSRNQGQNWMNASTGLPRRPHCADLRTGVTPGGNVLYLSTFGRSLWAAGIP